MGNCAYGPCCSNVHVEAIVNHTIDNTISMLYTCRFTRNTTLRYFTHLAVPYKEGVCMHVCTHYPLYATIITAQSEIVLVLHTQPTLLYHAHAISLPHTEHMQKELQSLKGFTTLSNPLYI